MTLPYILRYHSHYLGSNEDEKYYFFFKPGQKSRYRIKKTMLPCVLDVLSNYFNRKHTMNIEQDLLDILYRVRG